MHQPVVSRSYGRRVVAAAAAAAVGGYGTPARGLLLILSAPLFDRHRPAAKQKPRAAR